MEDKNSAKSVVTIIIVVVIVLVGGYLLLSGGGDSGIGQGSSARAIVENKPGLNEEQLLGKAEIPDTQRAAVAAHKQEILARAASSKPLTDAEKSVIGNIMLTQAHVYSFTAEEREAVFAALRR